MRTDKDLRREKALAAALSEANLTVRPLPERKRRVMKKENYLLTVVRTYSSKKKDSVTEYLRAVLPYKIKLTNLQKNDPEKQNSRSNNCFDNDVFELRSYLIVIVAPLIETHLQC